MTSLFAVLSIVGFIGAALALLLRITLEDRAARTVLERERRRIEYCRCGHWRAHHYACASEATAYCNAHLYASGREPCPCGVFTPRDS
jgi:hypothetical protein